MKKQLVIGLGLVGCVALALADDVKQGPAPKTANAPAVAATSTSSKAAEPYPVIGYLEKRDCVITIKSSPDGTIYSIATKDGKILHENVSAEQLKAKAPELYQAVKTGLATDARLWPQEKNPRAGFSGAIDSSRAPRALYMQTR